MVTEEIKESAETVRKYWIERTESRLLWQPIIKSKLRNEDDRFILDIDIDPGTQHTISTILVRNVDNAPTPSFKHINACIEEKRPFAGN